MSQRRSAETSAPLSSSRAAARTLDILELLAQKPDGLKLSEVAAELSVPISSLHALMHVLQARGYLHRHRHGRRYCLGPRLLEMSLGYRDRAEPFADARRAMHTVAERCGETVHVAVLCERDVIYLAGAVARHPLGMASRAGTRLPAYTTAAGQALLATLDDDIQCVAAVLPSRRTRGGGMRVRDRRHQGRGHGGELATPEYFPCAGRSAGTCS